MDRQMISGLQDFWTPFFAFALLLGVNLIIFGVGLAGYVSVLRARERETRTADQSAAPK